MPALTLAVTTIVAMTVSIVAGLVYVATHNVKGLHFSGIG